MAKANVLVVDDDPAIRDSLRRILTAQQYEVDTAGTAEEALMALPEKPFDVVLTDLQMPGMDGLTLLDEIKRRSPETPVVMITAHAMTDVVIQALRRGVSDFVTKPYKPDELLIIVEREAGRRKQLQAAAPAVAPPALGRQLSPRQLDEIDSLMAELRVETGARCVLMVEGSGHVIDAKGVIEDLNVSALAALVAGDLAATAGIASLIGEGTAFRLNYHEGERYSVYLAHLTPDVFLLIVVSQEVKSGMVLYATRHTIPRLKGILEQAPVASAPVITPAPAAADYAPSEAELTAGPDELFTLDQVLSSGLLDDDALTALDEQFKSLWN